MDRVQGDIFWGQEIVFNKRSNYKNKLFSFFAEASSTLIFTKSALIVKALIDELFHNSKDETILA